MPLFPTAVLTRRKLLSFGIAACVSEGLSGCVSFPGLFPNCPVSWPPNLVQPVFYGYKDYADCNCLDPRAMRTSGGTTFPNPQAGGPAVRVYYPSIEGTPKNAAILSMCERFPLVIFIHGDCDGDPYAQWLQLPAQLARTGHVVAVAQFGGRLATGDPAVTLPLRQLHDWMRGGWEYGDRLMPPPHTAVVGHSYGGTLGMQLTTEIPTMAFASLSGALLASADLVSLVSRLTVPSLFLWNDTDDNTYGAEIIGAWRSIRTPKHGVIFLGAHHADYMQPNTAGKCDQDGPCSNLVRPLAADFVTTFMAKYLPGDRGFTASGWVPDSLIVRPQDLPRPPQNGFYAGSFLTGFSASTQSLTASSASCVENVMWQTRFSTGSTFLIPA